MRNTILFIIAVLFSFFAIKVHATVLYVDVAKADNSGAGTSWATAKKGLQHALDIAASGDQVWVRAGTYLVPYPSPYFYMKAGVGVYGGFIGNETSLSQRNWKTNITTLSADANYVALFSGIATTSSCVLDGFTVANAGKGAIIIQTNSSPTIANCRFTNNINSNSYGGGMIITTSSPTIKNCYFDNNSANSDGGAISIQVSSNPQIMNCVFTNNTSANGWGGAINISNSSNPTITNCTIFNNGAQSFTAGIGGGVVSQSGCLTTVKNCIIWGNYSNRQSPNVYGTFTMNNSIIEGGYAGTGNINTNPNFVNISNHLGADNQFGTLDDGLRLNLCSPGINNGDNSFIPAGVTTDIAGDARIAKTNVDIGPYENNAASTSPGGISIDNKSCISSQPASNILNYFDACNSLITTVSSGGVSPITGITTAKVWIESSQPAQYVKRHYEITPSTNASTATSSIVLYFTQAEFDAFNAVNTVKLPTGPTDAIGKANLKIEKRSGVSSDGTGLPNTYVGTPVTIDPADNSIVWIAAANRWEVKFDVVGFSGFFAKTLSTALPVVFGDVSASIINGQLLVKWNTLSETDVAKYIIEISKDGNNFTPVGTVFSKAVAGVSTQPLQYEFSMAANSIMGLMGVSLAMLLLLPIGMGRRKLLLNAAVIIAVFTLTIASCSKKDVASAGKSKTLYVRVVQVDKVGTQQISKVVTTTVQ